MASAFMTLHQVFKSLLRWRMILVVVVLLILLLPQCVSVRMSDKKVAAYFANRPVKPQFGFVNVGNRQLHYAQIAKPYASVADTLPMVLFIHGSPGAWDAFIGFFADSSLYNRAQLVSVDRLGFGKSGLGDPETSLQKQAAAIAPLLQLNHNSRKPIVIGHSLGGPVAVRLAMDYPNEVGSLILVAPSIDPALEKQEWYRPLGRAFPIHYLLPTELDVSNREILPLKGELEQLLPHWASITIPVTIIQGEDDNLVPPGNAQFAKRMLTHASVTVEMIPAMNHFIPWRRPDLIHNAIIAQLTKQPTNSTINHK